MAWSAKKIQVDRDGTHARITLEYTNGSRTFAEVITISDKQPVDYLGKYVDKKLKSLAELDTYIEDIKTVSTITPIQETKDSSQLAREAYTRTIILYRHMLEAVRLGVISDKDTAVINAKQSLIDTFDPSYIDLF